MALKTKCMFVSEEINTITMAGKLWVIPAGDTKTLSTTSKSLRTTEIRIWPTQSITRGKQTESHPRIFYEPPQSYYNNFCFLELWIN